MRFRPFQIARLSGIPLMIDYSWVLMVLLHVWLVSEFWLPTRIHPAWSLWQNLLLSIDRKSVV